MSYLFIYKNLVKLNVFCVFFVTSFLITCCFASKQHFVVPVIDGPWWQVACNPDLGAYTSDKQQPVDFALWQAKDGSWQLWSCIRNTNCEGHTRLFHRWEGKKITDTNWVPMGVAMTSKAEFDEPPNGLQAPHVVKFEGLYWMVYGDWDDICLATSENGKNFKRLLQKNNSAAVFTEGPEVNTRDAMLLFTKDKWYCYYTACPGGKGYVFCRTSDDLKKWSDSVVVAYGGLAGNGWASAECPHIVELYPGRYYLFRTQYYGPGAKTNLYYSDNPFNFGVDNDSFYVRNFHLAAPEIIKDGEDYYIASLNLNLDGIRIARLKWKCFDQSVFDFNSEKVRKDWKRISGNLRYVFTSSKRLPFNPPEQWFIGTAETRPRKYDESLTGVIESPTFSISADECVVYVSGRNNVNKLYVAIIDADTSEEIERVTGCTNVTLKPTYINSPKLRDKKLKIRVVDQDTDKWGYINFGGIYISSD